jgi:sialate O-acetylesterase
MAMSVGGSLNAKEEIKNANHPSIRFFKVPNVSSFKPRKDIDANIAKWTFCSPRTVPGFSAAGYYFGRELNKELKVPIGLIQSAWGGTPALAWTSQEAAKKFKNLTEYYQKHRLKREKELGFIEGDSEKMQNWTATRIDYAKRKEELPKRLSNAQGTYRRIPSNLYNGMIAPLIPFAIRGVIWYQGEDDAGRAFMYRDLFRNLIRDWRKNWGQGDFPFYYVQLANWKSPLNYSYAEVRDSQSTVLDEPNVGMAVTIDIGNPDNVHPKNKQEVGRRLALNALAKTYGKIDLAYSGPTFNSMKIEGNKAILTFKNIHGGLTAKGRKLEGFAIADKKPEYEEIERRKGKKSLVKIRKFYPAEAQIEGDKIIVWSDKVKEPAAVRYGWDNSPVCNLYNKAGLPASPFRTDAWKLITEKRK